MYYIYSRMIVKDQAYFNLVKGLIEGAATEVNISQFKIDSSGIAGKSMLNQLLMTIASKAESGVKVKIILDCLLPLKGRSANNAFVALWLKKRHVSVKYLARNRCQHSKVVEVDGKHVVIGSHNWTCNSFTRNNEMSVYLTDADSIMMIKSSYEADYNGAIEYNEKMGLTAGGK